MFSQTRNVRDNMYAEFNNTFEVGKKFETREDLKVAIRDFGKKYNVIFSIEDSHPTKGQFAYICKHSGTKRDVEATSKDVPEKKQYKKRTQKFLCPAFINLYGFVVTDTEMAHNHPISQDVTTYALNRKQSPAVMQKILSILGSGIDNPVSHVMQVNKQNKLFSFLIHISTLIILDFGWIKHP